jgi:pyruvate dehydrogenase E1 component alpha subunit
MASLYKLPCIFVVENNKWAIGMQHMRATGPSAGDNEPFIYKKGPPFGMPGVLVDGMDVLKVLQPKVLVSAYPLCLRITRG